MKKLLSIVICIMIMVTVILSATCAEEQVVSEPTIVGIIGAMDEEVASLKAAVESPENTSIAGMEFCKGKLDGLDVVIVQCGVGKVNAGVCAHTLINLFGCTKIINTGVAGGMNTKVKVCDIVVSDAVCPHDLELRFLENYPPYHSMYEADEKLVNAVCQVCAEKNIVNHVGRIVSGEAFVSDSKLKQDICDRLSPLAVDMETAAVGQCAYRNNIPFVSVRCISDNADDEGEMSFDEFEKIAAKKVAEIVLETVKKI